MTSMAQGVNMGMSEAEMNRFCAEALGWRYEVRSLRQVLEEHESATLAGIGPCWWAPGKGNLAEAPPDFLHSESANAMLLEAMPIGTKFERVAEGWTVFVPHLDVMSTFDYRPQPWMRLVVLAYIAWKQKEQHG